MAARPRITVCVPVYNGGQYIAETLSSIQHQSYGDLTVLVSDDLSDDESASICRKFTQDSRFLLSIRPHNHGWVENFNWLLANAKDDFVCLVEHDDVLAPSYIEALVEHLSAEPDCILAFSDMQAFDLSDEVLQQPSICGEPLQRVLTFMARHHDATAFRGLIRRRALDIVGGLRSNEVDNFGIDVTWLGRLAHVGELHRVPQTLYRKRYRSDSVSLQWNAWDNAAKAKAWAAHCRELLGDALGLEFTAEEQAQIIHTALRRLLAIEPERPFRFIHDLSSALRGAMVFSMFGTPLRNSNEFDALLKMADANQLTKLLEASEADRAQRLENNDKLTRLLEASEVDRAQRLENNDKLTKMLEASEAERKRLARALSDTPIRNLLKRWLC